MDAGIVVKVEDYDGMCKCLFCGPSVRGQPALKIDTASLSARCDRPGVRGGSRCRGGCTDRGCGSGGRGARGVTRGRRHLGRGKCGCGGSTGGEPEQEGAAAARARSLRRQTPAWILEARARRRARELVWMAAAAAARARVARTMAQQRLGGGGAVWIAAAEEGWVRARGAGWLGRQECKKWAWREGQQ